ncbi:hypothetical protein [Bdellovibrio svalbardensis]|uniref:Secreted protein n=1 Tax=Bdellovibrio svalbardensis TaxID=2972972 RepID=A0ABT6DHR8_9BACT|nr:hypothetical protein [Bdellovibrio svalbardensis]MDG0816401.1 hypothetical protein [Bdellovibrio svalbardensis]
MKRILLLSLSLIFLSLQSFAQDDMEAMRIVYVDSSGTDSGYCRSDDYFCPRTLKDRAERNATQEAQNRCYLNSGSPLTYTASCNTYCTPSYIPPNTSAYVTCRSSCRMQCEVKD